MAEKSTVKSLDILQTSRVHLTFTETALSFYFIFKCQFVIDSTEEKHFNPVNAIVCLFLLETQTLFCQLYTTNAHKKQLYIKLTYQK